MSFNGKILRNRCSAFSLAIAKRCAKTLICAWVACELVGCADGRPEKGDTIQKFADRIRDRSYGGLDWVQASVAVYCRYAGGVLTVEVNRAAVQDDLICMVGLTPLWGFQANARHVGNTYSTYVLMPTLLTADQVAANEHVKWEASFGERRLSADKLREEADEASRQQALAAERLEQFRRNLRAGDRFEWRVPGRDYMTGVGTIIRLENDAMAFVQFDNVKISGQVTRYVPRSELRPVEKEVQRAFIEIP